MTTDQEMLDARAEMLKAITPAHSAKTAQEVHSEERSIRLRSADVGAGDVAPDFDLAIYDFSDGNRVETGRTFHLQSAAKNTPVALVFGSYT
jgi:hypothetical protein